MSDEEKQDWSDMMTGVMEDWEAKCLAGGNLREYLREARFDRCLGRVKIAHELQAKARAAGHRDYKVSDGTVGFALDRLGLQARRVNVPARCARGKVRLPGTPALSVEDTRGGDAPIASGRG